MNSISGQNRVENLFILNPPTWWRNRAISPSCDIFLSRNPGRNVVNITSSSADFKVAKSALPKKPLKNTYQSLSLSLSTYWSSPIIFFLTKAIWTTFLDINEAVYVVCGLYGDLSSFVVPSPGPMTYYSVSRGRTKIRWGTYYYSLFN